MAEMIAAARQRKQNTDSRLIIELSGTNRIWRYVAVFFAIFALALLFPYSNDDWAWGGTVGLERLSTFFKDYNGRYLGNLLVLALTRSNILKAAVMSATYVSIAYLSERIVDKNNHNLFYLVLAAVFLADKVLLRQTVVNTSGFTNYTFCMLLVLIYIAHISELQEGEKNKGALLNISLLALGFCTALFMEHITIYVVLLSAAACIYVRRHEKKMPKSNLFYFSGSVLGALAMFTNGAYFHVIKGDDFYRSAAPGVLEKIQKASGNLFLVLSENTIANHLFVNLVIGCLFIYLFAKRAAEFSDNRKKRNLSITAILFILLVNMYFIAILLNNDWLPLLRYTTGLTGVVAVIYFIFLLVSVRKLIVDRRIMGRLTFYLLSIAVLTIPLLVLSPVTPRCALPMYVFYILFMCELFSYTLAKRLEGRLAPIAKAVFLFFFCFSYLYLASIYSYISYKNVQRLADINCQLENGSSVVYVKKNQYDQYVWKNNPVSKTWSERFVDFYGLPKGTQIKVLKKDSEEYAAYTAEIPKDVTKLMIVAHPDDEFIWGGSHLFNDDYFVVCLTNGGNQTRAAEFRTVMARTDDKYLMLNFPDKVNGEKSDWSKQEDGIENVVSYIINARDWDEIITHNPDGEYGHIQHKKTSRIVTDAVPDKSRLIYFGKYYPEKTLKEMKAGGTPLAPEISSEEYEKKMQVFASDYPSQKKIPFYHMFRYENWMSFDEWQAANMDTRK